MVQNGDKATIREVYNLVEGLRADMVGSMKEMKNDMRDMKQSFETLEAGRLTHAESKIAYLEGRMFYIPILLTLGANLLFLLFDKFMGK